MSELARVRRAMRAKRRADEVYRAALQDALQAGCSYAELARALGTSRQQLRQWAARNIDG